jgi:hypothetical protein
MRDVRHSYQLHLRRNGVTTMNLAFRNPANGYVEESSVPWLWCLIFGCFYFAYKHCYMHAIIALVLAIFTAGFSWFIYPFFATKIIRHSYLQRGWQEVDGGESELVNRATNTMSKKKPRNLGIIFATIIVLVVLGKLFSPTSVPVPTTAPVSSAPAESSVVDEDFNKRQAAKRAAMKAH